MVVTKTITLSIPKSQINYIIKNTKYTFRDIVQLIHNILAQTLDFTTSDLEIWIRKKVPKRTGQLRQSLLEWLHSSNIQEGILRLILRSNIEYAADVNAMTTSQVAHKGQKGYVYYKNPFGIRGPVILWDPEAVGSFFDELILYAEERIMINLTKSIALYTTQPAYVRDLKDGGTKLKEPPKNIYKKKLHNILDKLSFLAEEIEVSINLNKLRHAKQLLAQAGELVKRLRYFVEAGYLSEEIYRKWWNKINYLYEQVD